MDRPLLSDDYRLKEVLPHLRNCVADGEDNGVDSGYSYDIVHRVGQLFVSVVRVAGLDGSGCSSLYAEAKLGNCKERTTHVEQDSNPFWNSLLSFSNAQTHYSTISKLEIQFKGAGMAGDRTNMLGRVMINLFDVPICVPSDACVAPQWYRLEDMDGIKTMGGILLAAWWGLQEVELTEAIDDAGPKVDFHPRLWYVRVVVVEANGVWSSNKSRSAEVFVKVTMGNQTMKTKVAHNLLLVAAEPFEEPLIVSLEGMVAINKSELLGSFVIPLTNIGRSLKRM